MFVRICVFGSCSLILIGCASTPDVQIPYYFPKAQVDIAITQTIGCYGTSDIRSADTPTVTTSYHADYGSVQYIKYQSFDGSIRDEDTAVTLTSDGRLSGINTSGTGEGATFVKSAVALAGVFVAPHASAIPFDAKEVCATVKTYNDNKGGGAPVTLATTTLTYIGRLEFIEDAKGLEVNGNSVDPNAGLQLEIPADAGSTAILKTLKAIPGATPAFIATVTPEGIKAAQPEVGTSFSGPTIKVPKMDLVNLAITGPADDLSGSAPVWTGDVLIPTRIPVDVPVTAASLFGKTATKVTLADSGLVTSLEYNKTSGAADLITSATEVSTAAEGPTPAQQASDYQAKANEIYEQHRLIECQLDTAKCTQN